MLNPNEEHALMEERKRQLLRAARIHELYQQADDERDQAGDRFMTLIGDLMISGGQKLKARSASKAVRYTADVPSL
ncbi:MAG: hypothetical protein GC204_15590 [Chloroflexi bacterium]|nr:hypothetical protein [Chloroflexota bacterium]